MSRAEHSAVLTSSSSSSSSSVGAELDVELDSVEERSFRFALEPPPPPPAEPPVDRRRELARLAAGLAEAEEERASERE